MSTDLDRAPGTPYAGAGIEATIQRPALVVAATLAAAMLVGLDTSAVNVALPAIGRGLGGSTAALQWIVDAYTLMFAALLLSAGSLSDRIGAKRMFGIGLTVFAAASTACGLAPALGPLIGARLVQGAAAAVMLPSSLALVRQAFPDARERGRAISLWAVGGSSAIAAGPVLGGVLTGAVGWRSIFFLNVPVGLAALAVLARVRRSPRRPAGLDPVGQLTATLTLAALTFGMIEGGARGFGRPVVVAAFGIAAAAAIGFVLAESRVADPLVPPDLFRSRTVSFGMLVGSAINVSFYGVLFVIGLFFQEVRGTDALRAGLLFLPMTALITAANLGSPRVAHRFGARTTIVVGQFVAAIGPFALLGVTVRTNLLLVAVLLIPLGAGAGLVVPSLITTVLDGLPAERAGLAGGVFNAGRQVGGALAVAAFGALVGQRASFVPGMHASFLVSGLALLATGVLALALPRRRER